MTAIVTMLFAGITVTVLVFVIIAYHRHKLHQRNQETPQPQGNQFHASVCLVFCYNNTATASYEEPYDWAVSRLQQTEPEMEQCPAYGMLTK